MTPKAFRQTLEELESRLSKINEPSRAQKDFFARLRFERAERVMKEARAAAGDKPEAWSCLVEAAGAIGYLEGLKAAVFDNQPEQLVRRQLAKNGAKGGKAKRRNGDLRRDRVVQALTAAVYKEKWKSRAVFERRYHEIIRDVAGYRHSDYQWRQLMKLPDFQAIYPPPTPNRR